jgi:hypothetical protein
MDNLYVQLNERFGNIHRLGFVSLLDTTEFHSFRKQFPEASFETLLGTYNTFFDSVRLKNELTMLYSSDDHDLNGKPVHEIVSYMKKKTVNSGDAGSLQVGSANTYNPIYNCIS